MASRSLLLLTLALLAAGAMPQAFGAGSYPEAAAWSPTGTNGPVEGPIRITWTMRMDPTSVQRAFSLGDGVNVWNGSDFQWTHSAVPPWRSEAVPNDPLPALQTLTATVAPTATDATGAYPLDQDGDGTGGEPTDGLAWSFRTENGRPPRIDWTTPSDGEANVSVLDDITVAFDEPMDTASVAAAWTVTPPADGVFSWTNGTDAVFDPYLYLAFGTTYEVRLDGRVAADANGHLLDGDRNGVGGDDYAFSFTTVPDTWPPFVLAARPVPGATNVSVTARIDLWFSETMNRTSVEESFAYADGNTTWNGTSGAFAWSGTRFADDTAEFNPYLNFPFSDLVTITFNGSAARDVAGHTLDGDRDGISEGSPADDYAWSYRTEAADTTPPTVASTDPPGGAEDVPETTAIGIEFTEMMNRTSAEDAFSLQDSVRTWTKADGWFSWAKGDEAVVFTPSTTLAYDRDCTIGVANTAKDVNGNRLDGDGAGGNFTSRFRTRPEPDLAAPHIVNTIPAGGQAGVARDLLFSITFDDAMDREATEGAISLWRQTMLEPVEVPIGPFEWDAEDHAVSYRPTAGELEWDAAYLLVVSQAAKDDAGNALAQPHWLTFTTTPWSGRVLGLVVSDGGPVGGATVRLGNQTTLTAGNGTFALPGVWAGTYVLTISKAGYETLRRTVTVNETMAAPGSRTIDFGEFRLEPVEGPSAALVLGVLFAALAAVLAVVWALRRRRLPPTAFGELEEEPAEARR